MRQRTLRLLRGDSNGPDWVGSAPQGNTEWNSVGLQVLET